VAADDAGLLDPRDRRAPYGATLLNCGGRGVHRPARPARRVSQAIFDEVEAGRGVETPDGPPVRAARHDARIPRPTPTISLPYMLRRYRSAGIDPLREAILTYPVLHYQNGGLVIDEHGETTLPGLFACGEIAAAPTGATG
jgi:succinate dehydrogenase/fumarate reductase flavoprotein subunit